MEWEHPNEYTPKGERTAPMKISGTLAERGFHAFDDEPQTHAGIKTPRLWVVVADREKAHIYRRAAHRIERIADAKAGHAKAHPEDAGAKGVVRHGYDLRSEKRHHDDSAFLQKLAAWLDQAAAENVFDKLVLVAPPHTLGDLRALLGKKTQAHLLTEVDKDWIKLTEKEIETHLSKVAWL